MTGLPLSPRSSTEPSSRYVGTFHACDKCGKRWEGGRWPRKCPTCAAAPWWIASSHTREERDAYTPLCRRPPEAA